LYEFEALKELRVELAQVRELRSQIEKELAEIKQMKVAFKSVQPHVVMIRSIDEDEAEQEIVQYLQTHDHADTGELVEKLRLDVDVVLNVVQRLKEQGKVERVDSHESG